MLFSAYFSKTRQSHRALCKRPAFRKPTVERLENRNLLSVNPLGDFAGMEFSTTFEEIVAPPDTHVAAGPEHLVEVVNHRLAFFKKSDGASIFEKRLDEFFASVGAPPPNIPGGISSGFDPKVTYDELAGRFVVIALERVFSAQTSHLWLAVSDDADPMGKWEKHRINVEDAETYWWDYTGLGWDADAIYVTGNMGNWPGPYIPADFDHVSVITIDKASVLDGDPDTLAYTDVDLRGPEQFSLFALQPAVMHGANPGDPMYFVSWGQEKGSGWYLSHIKVLQMTDKLAAAPTFTEESINVPYFVVPPNPSQPGTGSAPIATPGLRMLNAAWRDDHLVASQTVGFWSKTDWVDRARWYDINTSSKKLTLNQSGEIDPGPGIHTFWPSVDIAPNGDLGMTYSQSSTDTGDANGDGMADGYLSMYITGRKAADPLGVMQPPVLVKAGEAIYSYKIVDPPIEFKPYRTGDYSATVIDPVDGTFWAANEYATDAVRPNNFRPDYPFGNWGTWIANFSINSGGAALTATQTASRPVAQPLSQRQVEPLLIETLARWQATGVDTIWLDSNDAGWGWFIDLTPGDDSEFTTPGNQVKQNRVDLFTVIEHELWHLLGKEHEDVGVMDDALAPGIRVVRGVELLGALDQVFGEDLFFGKKHR